MCCAGMGAAGLLFPGCTAMENLDRGLYNVHRSATEEDLITGQRTLGFHDRSEQISRGNAIMERIVGKYRYINRDVDPRNYARLLAIFGRIHRVSHYAHEDWEVLLLPEESFNAFVTGGTCIAVHWGLMDLIQDDAAVAAVLGHEIGHVTANHVFEKQGALIRLAESTFGDGSRTGSAFAYNTLNEVEADKIGIVYTALAGYDPRAVSVIWDRIARQYGDNWSWFRTHPANSDRARATAAMADRARPYFTPGRINPNHAALARCNLFWCNE